MNVKRLVLSLTSMVVLSTSLAACQPAATPTPAAPSQGDVYKIGIIASITGANNSLGIPERDTALMLQQKINEAGGVTGPDGLKHTLAVIVEDDGSDPTKATLVVKKLIEQDEVAVLIGSSGSSTSLAMIESATTSAIPMISMAAATAIVSPVAERQWIFKTPQETRLVIQVQVDYLKAKGFTKVASIGLNNAFGNDSREAMKTLYAEAGIEILADELFQPGDKDFTAQLTKIQALNPQAVIVHSTTAEAAPLTVQYRALGLTAPLLHNHGIGNINFITLADKAAEGVIFPIGKLLAAESLPDSDPQKAVLLQYIADYTAYTNGQPISTFGGHAWDAVQIAVAGLEAVGPDRAALRDYFETQVKNFVGITGVFNWSATDHVGIGKESLVLVEIKDKKWVYVAPDQYANVP